VLNQNRSHRTSSLSSVAYRNFQKVMPLGGSVVRLSFGIVIYLMPNPIFLFITSLLFIVQFTYCRITAQITWNQCVCAARYTNFRKSFRVSSKSLAFWDWFMQCSSRLPQTQCEWFQFPSGFIIIYNILLQNHIGDQKYIFASGGGPYFYIEIFSSVPSKTKIFLKILATAA
jgi:hypothetical protein